jgi:colanic acid/amylovoran biosynthesis glycosyltransferase
MEAMAKEVASVSTRITGIPELIEDGRDGVLVAPANALELADKLQQLIEDPELRKQLGAAGRVRVINDYDLKKNSQVLGDLFKSLGVSEG